MSAATAGGAEEARVARTAAAGGAALFVALAWGAAAGPHLFDAGEIVAAGAQLGGSHPPGQPLHAMVAHAAVLLLPLGPIAWRVALVSALFGALAAVAGARVVWDAVGHRARVAPFVALVAIPIAPAIAPQLGRPEVYTLALLLALEGARGLLRWARGEASGLRRSALCAGLAVAVHPPHALALVAIGAAILLTARRDTLRRPRALGWASLACVVGMLAIAYLPLRGLAGAPMWGDPTSAAGLWEYVSASAYRRNLGTEGGTLLGNAAEVVAHVIFPAGLGALLALAALVARAGAPGAVVAGALVPHQGAEPAPRRALGVLALAAAAAIAAACLQRLEPRNPDNVAYAGPALALFVALGASSLAILRDARARALGATALVTLAIASGDLGALRADLPQLEPLAFAVVDAPPPRALVIAKSDFVAAAWMQARGVEGARPDVALLVEGLAGSSWHWRTLSGHPPFDGTPVRSGPGAGHDPWVRGAIARASGALPILSEYDAPVAGRGAVLGPYLLLDAARGARVATAFAERTIGAPARMIPWTPPGHGGAAHGVVREVEIARARRLFVRDRADLAIAGLARAAAPLGPDAIAPALGVAGHPMQPPPPVIHDPEPIYATAEDAIRDLAAVLVGLGATERAIALLAMQAERGDDRAVLELAWLHRTLGRLDDARAALARYRALHPDREGEIAPLAAALEAPP